MRKMLFLIVLTIVSCSDHKIVNQGQPTEEPFTLKVGQSIVLKPDNLEVGFWGVINDSRCPINALCVWQGLAEIDLWLLPPSSDSVFVKSYIYGYVTQNDTTAHVSTDTLDYRITLLQLNPYPGSDSTAQSADYEALLLVSKL